MTHMLLCHGGLIQSGAITKNQRLSCYWSAAVHDYEHGGLNNDFLIKTFHPLAGLYNDQSPLENHHVSAAVSLLKNPEYAYLSVSDCLQRSHQLHLLCMYSFGEEAALKALLLAACCAARVPSVLQQQPYRELKTSMLHHHAYRDAQERLTVDSQDFLSMCLAHQQLRVLLLLHI